MSMEHDFIFGEDDPESMSTAICGLYCGDCIPGKKVLFRIVNELKCILADLNFENYAALKAGRDQNFSMYPEFLRVLDSISRLECHNGCRRGPVSETGCRSDCDIRRCAAGKGYSGCHECAGYKNCSLLEPMKRSHPSLEANLDNIKRYGINRWSDKRGKHYNWQL